MSKLFETIRRLEKQSDSVSADSAAETPAAFPVASGSAAAATAPAFEKPAPVENGNHLSIRWPVPPVEDPIPAAQPGSRVVAAAFDVGMVLIALGLFAGVFLLSGGAFSLSRDVPLLASVLAILALFYWFLCLLANRGTPGMQFVGRNGLDSNGSLIEGEHPGLRQLAPVPPPRTKATLPLALPGRAATDELVMANKILVNEGVTEAYGNVSVRDERNPNRFYLADPVVGSLVASSDIVEYDLEGEALTGDPFGGNTERFIHSEIYKARPDVMAIVQWRAPEVIPFGVSTVPLLPVSQAAAFLAEGVPVFEMAIAEGGTALTARTQFAGQALAETLGDKPAALMRGHGAVVVAASLHAAVVRAYHMNMNARLQAQAILLGGQVTYLELAESRTAQSQDETERTWDLWKQKLTNRRSTPRSGEAEARQAERFSARASGAL